MSVFLIFRKRNQLINVEGISILGFIPTAIGLFLAAPWGGIANLSLQALGIVLFWTGTFLFFLGFENFRKLLFPLLSLILMIPIPGVLLEHIITALQRGSAEASAILFKMTGTTFFREGLRFHLHGITIDIAPECSSIRSSLALLISSLLASHLLLGKLWSKTVLVLVAVPLSMLKNAIRIVTLSLLAIHVDARWLTASSLHHSGGIVFFLIALIILFPVLLVLRKLERKTTAENQTVN